MFSFLHYNNITAQSHAVCLRPLLSNICYLSDTEIFYSYIVQGLKIAISNHYSLLELRSQIEFCYSVGLYNYHFLQIWVHLRNQSTHLFNWCGTWILQVAVKLHDGTYSEAAKENMEGSLIWTAGDKCKIAENLIMTQKRKEREKSYIT